MIVVDGPSSPSGESLTTDPRSRDYVTIYFLHAVRHRRRGHLEHAAVRRLQRRLARSAGDRGARAAGSVRDGQAVARASTRCCGGRSRSSRSFAIGDGAPIGISLLNKRIGVGTALLYELEPGARIALSRTARPAVRARRSAGAGVDGRRRRRARAVPDAREALHARGTPTTLFYGARRAAELF